MPTAVKEIEKERWSDLIERARVAVGAATIAEMAELETLWSVANAGATAMELRPPSYRQIHRSSGIRLVKDLRWSGNPT
jgi:hypothetical protein